MPTSGSVEGPTSVWANEALKAQSGDCGSLWLPEVSSARTFTTLGANVFTHSVIPGRKEWPDAAAGMYPLGMNARATIAASSTYAKTCQYTVEAGNRACLFMVRSVLRALGADGTRFCMRGDYATLALGPL